MNSFNKKLNDKLNKLDYKFKKKPILIGGMALEYYGVRETGHDVDFIISQDDKFILLKKGYKLNLFGGKTESDVDATFTNIDKTNIDLAVSMNQYKYHFFAQNAQKVSGNTKVLVASLEDLLLLKVIAEKYSKEKKHAKDVKLILDKIAEVNYKK